MQYRPLGSTGLNLSTISLGTAPLGGNYGGFDRAEGIRAVHTALDMGINLIDTAPYYGITRSETALGEALQGIPRDRYYLSTKVGRYGLDDFDFSPARMHTSIDESLARLQQDYVDILIVHDIEFRSMEQVVEETIPELRKIQQQGKFRWLGVSGLPLKIYRYVLERTDLDVILSYCHYTLNDNSLAELVPFLKSKNVGIINAAPVSMGLLTQSGPPEWHPASPEIKAACARAAEYCAQHGADLSRLAIQYAVANPAFATTIVGSTVPSQVLDNIKWAQEPIDQALLDEVLKILEPIHNLTWPSGRPENN